MSNFTFLSTDWPDLYETAREAEQNVNSAPRTSCFYARRSLERAVKWLYANDSYLKQPYADNLAALIHEPTFRENLEPCLFPKILTIQKIGNLAVHSDIDYTPQAGMPRPLLGHLTRGTLALREDRPHTGRSSDAPCLLRGLIRRSMGATNRA